MSCTTAAQSSFSGSGRQLRSRGSPAAPPATCPPTARWWSGPLGRGLYQRRGSPKQGSTGRVGRGAIGDAGAHKPATHKPHQYAPAADGATSPASCTLHCTTTPRRLTQLRHEQQEHEEGRRQRDDAPRGGLAAAWQAGGGARRRAGVGRRTPYPPQTACGAAKLQPT